MKPAGTARSVNTRKGEASAVTLFFGRADVNFYPFHIGDYSSHTGHLEPLEDLAYRRMLDVYYLRESPLPHDVEQVAKLIRMRAHFDQVKAILDEFFCLTDAGWRHERCEAELERMSDKREKAQAAARASVKARSTSAQRTLSERSTDVQLPVPVPVPTPEKKERERTARGTRLDPAMQLPDDWRDYCKANRPDLDAAKVFENFRDYWIAKSGQNSTKLDWAATWRTWVRHEKQQRAGSEKPKLTAFRTSFADVDYGPGGAMRDV